MSHGKERNEANAIQITCRTSTCSLRSLQITAAREQMVGECGHCNDQ